MTLSPADLFDLEGFAHRELFEGCTWVWDALPRIAEYVRDHARSFRGEGAVVEPGVHLSGDVSIGPGTLVEAGAYVRGPAIIGANCEIRTGAYIRGDALVGDGCIVGNSTELKNTVLLDRAMAPHYNYCGDSILGNDANLGAGTKLSNYKIAEDKTIRLQIGDEWVDTGLIKFGAILGDGVNTGCNSVLNPGTVLGRNVLVYANAAVRGYVPANTIVKLRQTHEHTELKS
jgi:NDP-sugar pyrophosphorylase family protein